jgi:LPS export ABC transporter protein LptC
MIKNPRNLLWILPLLVFISSPLWQPLVAAFLTPRGGYNPKLAQIEEQTPAQNFSMDEVSITLASEGQEEWQIDADRAYTGDDDHVIELEAVNAMYIGTEKEPTNITSLRGRYRIDDRHLTLIDKVVITKPTKNQQLFSELLDYYDATKMVVSPGPVRLRGPDLNLSADRMDYDLASEGYDFSGRVKVKM